MIEETGGLRTCDNEIVQPAHASPSSHTTGCFLEVGFSNASATFVVNSISERPSIAAVVAQYLMKSLLLIPCTSNSSRSLLLTTSSSFIHSPPSGFGSALP